MEQYIIYKSEGGYRMTINGAKSPWFPTFELAERFSSLKIMLSEIEAELHLSYIRKDLPENDYEELEKEYFRIRNKICRMRKKYSR